VFPPGESDHRHQERVALVFVAIIAVVLVLDLACYVLYYRLTPWASYLDGMVPLVLAGLVMAGMCVSLAERLR